MPAPKDKVAFEVVFAPNFRSELQKKWARAPLTAAKIEKTALALRQSPFPNGLRTKPIRGARGYFEARFNDGGRLTWKYGSNRQIELLHNCDHDTPGSQARRG